MNEKEQEVWKRIDTPYGGTPNKKIAEELGLTKGEVKRLRKQVVKKMGLKPGR